MKHLFYLLILTSIMWSCKEQTKKSETKTPKSSEIVFKKEGTLQIMDSLGQEKARFDIELATDDYKRETGLMYRKSMQDNQAMLFVFEDERPRYFYMKNTYLPLDIIYIGADKKIVSIIKNAKVLDETSLPSQFPAQYVLEIKAGLSDTYNITPGDKVTWEVLPNQD